MRACALVGLALLTAGCASDPDIPAPSPLPELEARLIVGEEVWSSDTGAGAGDRVTGLELAVDGRRVYTGNPGGAVTALDLEDGDTVWQVDSGRRLISGPTVADGRLLFGSRDGLVIALSAEDGSALWHTKLGSEVLAAPAANADTVVVRTLDGRVVALEMATGEHLWTVERQVPTLTLRGTASPVIVGDRVYAGLDNGTVLALDLDTGEQLWVQQVAAATGRSELERVVDIDAGLLVADDDLYAASVGKRLVSISRSSGRVRWSREIASRTGMSFDTDQLFATDLDGRIWSLDRRTGASIWKQEALTYRGIGQPVMYRGYVMVADFEGYLHWLIPEDGSLIGRTEAVGAPIRATPVVVGDLILVLGSDGTVVAIKGVFAERQE